MESAENTHNIESYIKKYSSSIEGYIQKRCNDFNDIEDLIQLVYEHLIRYKVNENQNSPWQAIKKSCNQVLYKYYSDANVKDKPQKCPLWQQYISSEGDRLDSLIVDHNHLSESEIILRLYNIKNKYPEHVDIIDYIIYTFQSRTHPANYMEEDQDIPYTWRILRKSGIIDKNRSLIIKIIKEVLGYE